MATIFHNIDLFRNKNWIKRNENTSCKNKTELDEQLLAKDTTIADGSTSWLPDRPIAYDCGVKGVEPLYDCGVKGVLGEAFFQKDLWNPYNRIN